MHGYDIGNHNMFNPEMGMKEDCAAMITDFAGAPKKPAQTQIVAMWHTGRHVRHQRRL
jgi:hypothetical protein